jgi:hypothetical protein
VDRTERLLRDACEQRIHANLRQMAEVAERRRETDAAASAAQGGGWVLIGDLFVRAPPRVAVAVVRAGRVVPVCVRARV